MCTILEINLILPSVSFYIQVLCRNGLFKYCLNKLFCHMCTINCIAPWVLERGFSVIGFLKGHATYHVMPCSDNRKQFLYIFKATSLISLLQILLSGLNENISVALSCKYQNECSATFGIYINNCLMRCNTKQSIYYSASSLYMFRVSTTPIIRSTQNCNYSLWYWSHFLCSYLSPTWPRWREVAAQYQRL